MRRRDGTAIAGHGRYRIDAASSDGPLRAAAEAFVGGIYAERYGARLSAFAKDMVVVRDDRGAIVAAAGVAAGGPFLSEAYLEAPAEALISTRVGRPVARAEILEVTSLASTAAGGAFLLLAAVVEQGRRAGRVAGLFTATERLRRRLVRARLHLLDLGPATAARLPASGDYGSYYDHAPRVCALTDDPANPVRFVTAQGELAEDLP